LVGATLLVRMTSFRLVCTGLTHASREWPKWGRKVVASLMKPASVIPPPLEFGSTTADPAKVP